MNKPAPNTKPSIELRITSPHIRWSTKFNGTREEAIDRYAKAGLGITLIEVLIKPNTYTTIFKSEDHVEFKPQGLTNEY
jgi:hypothetical protein